MQQEEAMNTPIGTFIEITVILPRPNLTVHGHHGLQTACDGGSYSLILNIIFHSSGKPIGDTLPQANFSTTETEFMGEEQEDLKTTWITAPAINYICKHSTNLSYYIYRV